LIIAYSKDVRSPFSNHDNANLLAFSAFTDLILALFPITIVWGLQMNMRTKCGVVVIMGLGIIATVASCIKTTKIKDLALLDFTYAPIMFPYWYTTENWAIIIAACIPTLPPLLRFVLGKPHASAASPMPFESDNPSRGMKSTQKSMGNDDDYSSQPSFKPKTSGEEDIQMRQNHQSKDAEWGPNTIMKTTEITVV